MKSKIITESGILIRGTGILRKILTLATASGTLQVIDGIENSVKATGVLTSAGASAPADYATQTITSTGVNVTDGDTCTIGTTVYRFKNTLAAAYDVKIGASAAATLDNLKAAINATGTAGTEYFVGTLVHPTVIATTNADTTQIIRAKTIGTAANSIATTEAAVTLSWGAATMANGVAVTNALITIGTRVYTAVLTLPESIGLDAIPDYILWVTSEAVFLDNLKKAINESGTAGTDYSAGTLQNFDVLATTNTNTAQTIESRRLGSVQNNIATTETLANYSWGAVTLENGSGAIGKLLIPTYTPSAGAIVDIDISYSYGLYIVVGGTSISTVINYE